MQIPHLNLRSLSMHPRGVRHGALKRFGGKNIIPTNTTMSDSSNGAGDPPVKDPASKNASQKGPKFTSLFRRNSTAHNKKNNSKNTKKQNKLNQRQQQMVHQFVSQRDSQRFNAWDLVNPHNHKNKTIATRRSFSGSFSSVSSSGSASTLTNTEEEEEEMDDFSLTSNCTGSFHQLHLDEDVPEQQAYSILTKRVCWDPSVEELEHERQRLVEELGRPRRVYTVKKRPTQQQQQGGGATLPQLKQLQSRLNAYLAQVNAESHTQEQDESFHNRGTIIITSTDDNTSFLYEV